MRRAHIVLLGVSWLLVVVAAIATLRAPLWPDCAGDQMSGSDALAFTCLLVALFTVVAVLGWMTSGALRPVLPLVVTGGLCLLTGGGLAVVGLIWWQHRYSCAGG